MVEAVGVGDRPGTVARQGKLASVIDEPFGGGAGGIETPHHAIAKCVVEELELRDAVQLDLGSIGSQALEVHVGRILRTRARYSSGAIPPSMNSTTK